MPADRLHLVRHGEVHNPSRVLYGRLPEFRLSVDGRRMARLAAEHVHSLARPVGGLVSSPLLRTRESSEPFSELFGIEPLIDERVIEPTNVFEGREMRRALRNPLNWRHLRRPSVPSWGEPYAEVIARMDAAMTDAWNRADGGDVVIVSHQLPIWVTHLAVAGLPAKHDPRRRRCALSSVTSFERRGDRWVEVGYADPASTPGAIDAGSLMERSGSWMRRTAAVLLAATLAGGLAACTSDPLAEQYRAGDNKGFVAGDGSVKEIAPADRGEPVKYTGTTGDGDAITNADYAGKVVVVNFWYAGCGPCRAEAKDLEKVYQEYEGQGATFLGVNTSDQAEGAASFAKTYGISYPSVIDSNDKTMVFAFSKYTPLSATPVTLVLDKTGRVAARFIGQIESSSILSTIVRDALAETS